MKEVINGIEYQIAPIAKNAMRISDVAAKECCLDRYGITKPASDASLPNYEIKGNTLILKNEKGEALTTVEFSYKKGGWCVSFTLAEKEHLYGLGDVTRDRLDKRGYKCNMWVTNVQSYQPIPYLMSSRGWAVTVNTTYQHTIDAQSKSDALLISARDGAPDISLYTGADYAELLKNYTSYTGRPSMLPKWAMGLTYVCNTDIDAFGMMNEAYTFRNEEIPCDIIGLEPGWMETNYDPTVKKKWSDTRFRIPSYCQKGPHTFFGALNRLGYKLSLWLCCNYDLFQYEEEKYEEAHPAVISQEDDDSFEKDTHLVARMMKSDNLTIPGEPWFEHLKKFVDQGAACFKLDGAYQVLEHPDRLWAGKYRDDEMHNLYPVVYAKQMSEGFTSHTGRRSMIYSAGGYTGIQKYAATWAGDTGGGFAPLVSLLNLGMCGHSNTSCDMEVFSNEGIHFGFLQPWAQLNNWFYWRQPWYLTEEGKAAFRDYDNIRYALAPYMYTAAHQAYETGMPVMRALPLVYPDDERAYERLTEYMLGDSLLVGAFLSNGEREKDGKKTNMYLPKGRWYDFFTGELYEGEQEIEYIPPKNRGGALFVKEGSVIPMADKRQFIESKPEESYVLYAYGKNASGILYTDDGISMKYQEGEGRLTTFTVKDGALTVSDAGSYENMPEVSYTLEIK